MDRKEYTTVIVSTTSLSTGFNPIVKIGRNRPHEERRDEIDESGDDREDHDADIEHSLEPISKS